MAQTKIKLIADGVIDVNNLKAGHTITTDNIGEGTNLYYTDARVGSYLSANSYATEGYVTTAVSNLVDAAPSTLDTLNELAAALGDDPNFATTVTNSIATKLPLAGGTISGNLTVSGSLTGTLSTAAQPNITSVGTLSSLAVSGDLTVDTSTLKVDSANNRVGVGTASPASKLEIADALPTIRLTDVDVAGLYSTIEGNAGALVLDADGGNVLASSTIRFRVDNTERMRITSSGNVGIGTTSPTNLLSFQTSSGTNNTSYGIIDATTDNPTYKAQINLIREDTSGKLGWAFLTNNIGSPTERMRIDSTGNVGIGTSSPSRILEVSKSTALDSIIRVVHTVNGYASQVLLEAKNDDGGRYNAIRSLTTGGTEHWSVSGSAAINTMVLKTAGSERMRITSGGQLQVGGTAQSFDARIVVHRNGYSIESRSTGTGSEGHFVFRNGNGAVGTIFTNGTSTAYNTSSDYRLKEDCQPLEGALNRVDALKPINFAWKVDGSRVDGFLANQVAEVIPEAITGEKDAVDEEGNPIYQGIDQSKLVPLLTAAIQELNKKIQQLENKLTANGIN
jgi:hypothetical protein